MENDRIITFRASDGNTVRLEYRESLPSAAQLAREYANAGYPDRYAVFTERQTVESATGGTVSDDSGEEGIYISCILRPSIFPSQAGLLGPLSAVALSSALEDHTDKKIEIGWVSEIYCDGRRIGGCSLEGRLDNHTSYEYLIVNFSVKTGKKNFPPRLSDMIRKVFEQDNFSIGVIIAKNIIDKFFGLYRDIRNPAKYMDLYLGRFALTGKKIKYIEDGSKSSVRVIGIDKSSCALIVQKKDGYELSITSPSSVIIPNKL